MEIRECCECSHLDDREVSQIDIKNEEELYDLAELFKVFGDTTRIKILYTLYNNEICVCDIAKILSMTQSAVSHQLRVLKQARLVKFRKEGKTVFYSLDDNHINSILGQGLEHIKENSKGI